MKYEELSLKDNTELNRFELDVDGSTAFLEYKRSRDWLFLNHTEVPEIIGGKGVASAVIQKSFQYAKDNNYKIVPICPFVQSFLKRHPEWNEIVVPDVERFTNKP
jgi:predicted GNAT family acetyltransferase